MLWLNIVLKWNLLEDLSLESVQEINCNLSSQLTLQKKKWSVKEKIVPGWKLFCPWETPDVLCRLCNNNDNFHQMIKKALQIVLMKFTTSLIICSNISFSLVANTSNNFYNKAITKNLVNTRLENFNLHMLKKI